MRGLSHEAIFSGQIPSSRVSSPIPECGAGSRQKGILLGRRRDLAGARREFETALQSDPNSVEALGGLVALDLAAKQPAARSRA